jgi:hypothetical protein
VTPREPGAHRKTIERLLEALEAVGRQGAIIGGVGVGAHGIARLTKDVDAATNVDNESLAAFCEEAAIRGLQPRRADWFDFAKQTRMLLLRDTHTETDVDVALVLTQFEYDAINRAEQRDVGGLVVPVATPEDLIVMKMVAGRGQDLVDVDQLIETNRDLDLKRVRHWLREFDDALDNPGLPAQFETIRAAVLARDA